LSISQSLIAKYVIRSTKKLKILTGVVIHIKVSGVDLCGGAVERRNKMLLVVDFKSMLIKMKSKKRKLLMKNK